MRITRYYENKKAPNYFEAFAPPARLERATL
jgi:hypothetical protein